MKLPASIVKKYGITKKAWSVYRGSHHHAVHRVRSKNRRKTGVVRMARHRGYHRRGSRGLLGGGFLMKAAVGAGAGYLAAKMNLPFIKNPLIAGAAGYVVGKTPMAVGAAAGSWIAGGASTNLGSLTNLT